uniref:Uncharacterized protein n=1 Tax=Anopheles epiroticus TaxID=199890 RepID=A0A182PD51_9DIPT
MWMSLSVQSLLIWFRPCFCHISRAQSVRKESSCPGDKFRCKNGRCILKRWQCDGERDCADGSDEDPQQCLVKTCPSNEILCKSADRCIPKSWLCDREADCPDGSDEQNCGK